MQQAATYISTHIYIFKYICSTIDKQRQRQYILYTQQIVIVILLAFGVYRNVYNSLVLFMSQRYTEL